MRINALTRSYEQEFNKYGIPYKVFGGFKFFERKEIKDVLAYMRLISNPFDDEAFTRIINVPKRGIGGKTLLAMEDYARPLSLSLYDACIDVDELPLSSSAKSKIEDFAALIKSFIISSQSESVGELVREIIAKTDLKSAYEDGTEEGDGKIANLDEFIAAVDDFVRLNPQASLNDYLNQVTLASDTDEMDDGNYVTLATIHSVKGLEFNDVFICGMEDGIMPSSRSDSDPASLEEERRLMYVAITRARKRLWITRSKSRYLYGRREPTRPSRFILELKDELGISEGSLRYGTSQYGNSQYGRPSSSWGGIKRSNGYEGDFWDGAPSRGKSLYSSDDGYTPDTPSVSFTGKSSFSAASSFGGFKSASKPTTQGNGGKTYAVGTKVRHPKFGVGTIIATKNNGTVLNVAFENQGIRELSASLAPLEII